MIVFAALFVSKLALLVWMVFYPIALSEAGKIRLEGPVLMPLIRFLALNNIVATLSKWSYSTYLVHIPVFALFVGGYATFAQLTQPAA
tara:strand:- start:5576 stop:5839 length:264 start_codon:yes stop_codon:yes gene_type:complete